MSPNIQEKSDACTLKKGVIWYCKDTLLSRWNWRERYFILTKDYLSCFKKAKSQYSDMGAFLFKVRRCSHGSRSSRVSSGRRGTAVYGGRAPSPLLGCRAGGTVAC